MRMDTTRALRDIPCEENEYDPGLESDQIETTYGSPEGWDAEVCFGSASSFT